MRLLCFTALLAVFFSCKNRDAAPVPPPAAATSDDALPAHADSASVRISQLNCWTEQGQFFVVGICDNRAGAWQRIWLRMEPTDGKGQALRWADPAAAIFPTHSRTVPPLGRTSFLAGWPLSAFSGQPVQCRVSGAGASAELPGAMLVGTEQSGVRMLAPDPADASKTAEKGWQASVLLQNPLNIPANRPCAELLIYGKDQRLWFSQVLDPSDPALRGVVSSTGDGPLVPQEQRRLNAQIFYPNLPQPLQAAGIGRVEFLPFDKR
jgi:hypothetical protein